MSDQRCKTCRFWLDEPVGYTEYGYDYDGSCRRGPATALVLHETITSAHPPRNKDDWCGEWKPKGEDDCEFTE